MFSWVNGGDQELRSALIIIIFLTKNIYFRNRTEANLRAYNTQSKKDSRQKRENDERQLFYKEDYARRKLRKR